MLSFLARTNVIGYGKNACRMVLHYARNVADRANENKMMRHYGIVEAGGTLADEDLLTIEAEDVEEV